MELQITEMENEKTSVNCKSNFIKMKLIFTALAFFTSMSVVAQLSDESILVDGLNREYLLYLPSGFDSNESLPLVLNFHGGTGRSAPCRRRSREGRRCRGKGSSRRLPCT